MSNNNKADNDNDNDNVKTTNCLQSTLQNPKVYFIVILISFIYLIILISIEWNNSDCYGVSQNFNWKYYLLTTMCIFIIYQLYLICLSTRFCLKLLIKPKVGLLFHLFLGNSILLIIWLIYGIIDWNVMTNNDCSNNHIIIGYLTLLILYLIICSILSILQCIFGVKQYKKRIKHIHYIQSQQRKQQSQQQSPQQSEEQQENNNGGREVGDINNNNIQQNIETLDTPFGTDDNEEENIEIETFNIPPEQLKEFIAEYDYFDGLDFSRSNLIDGSSSNINIQQSPQNPSRLQQSPMPTLNEMKSDNNHGLNGSPGRQTQQQQTQQQQDGNLEVPPPLSRDGTAHASKSLGGRSLGGGVSFSNLFLGEAREMSSTMFLNAKKDDSDLICMICLTEFEPHDSIGGLMCHHIFHKKCIYEWLTRNPSCPLCRENCEKFADVPFL